MRSLLWYFVGLQALAAIGSGAETSESQIDCFLDKQSFELCCCGPSPACLQYPGGFEGCCAHLLGACPAAGGDDAGWELLTSSSHDDGPGSRLSAVAAEEAREPGGVKLRGYPGPKQDCFPDSASFSGCCCGVGPCDQPEKASHRCCDHIAHNCPDEAAWQADANTEEDDMFVEGNAPAAELDAAQRDAFATEGFLSLPSLFQADAIEQARRFLDEVVWRNDSSARPPISVRVDFALQTEKEVMRDLGAEESRRTRASTYRLECEAVVQSPLSPWGRLANDPKLMAIVDELTLDACRDSSQGSCAPPVVNGCLFFERGTQQGLHDDTWYALASDTAGGMVGVWIALDDVDEENGPLIWFPGTHLWEEVALSPEAPSRQERLASVPGQGGPDAAELRASVERKLEEQGCQQRSYLARAGDVGIWHERLVHGGAPIKDMSRTRRSIVIHYARFKLNTHPLANLLDTHLHQVPGGCLERGFCVADELVVMMLWRSSWLRLCRTFGTLDNAWRLADEDENGAVSIRELNAVLAYAGMDIADRRYLLRRASIAAQHT